MHHATDNSGIIFALIVVAAILLFPLLISLYDALGPFVPPRTETDPVKRAVADALLDPR